MTEANWLAAVMLAVVTIGMSFGISAIILIFIKLVAMLVEDLEGRD